MKERSVLTVCAVGIATAVGIAACDQVSVVGAEAAALEVSPGSMTLEINDTGTFRAEILDVNGGVIEGQTVLWSSSDDAIATIDAEGNVRGLTEGTATIAARVGGVSNSAQVIVESLPNFGISRTAVSMTAISGTSTGPENVQVSGTGSQPATGLSLQTAYGSGGSGWLQASLSSTTTPATIQLDANAQSLAPGDYDADVFISANRVPNRRIDVSLTVLQPPTIGLSATSANMTGTQGDTNADIEVINVTNVGAGGLTGIWAAVFYGSGQPGNWLTATLDRTSAPARLTLRATGAFVQAGTYSATVRVNSPTAVNSPRDISVSFVVQP